MTAGKAKAPRAVGYVRVSTKGEPRGRVPRSGPPVEEAAEPAAWRSAEGRVSGRYRT